MTSLCSGLQIVFDFEIFVGKVIIEVGMLKVWASRSSRIYTRIYKRQTQFPDYQKTEFLG